MDDSEVVKKMSCSRTKAGQLSTTDDWQPFALEVQVVLDKPQTVSAFLCCNRCIKYGKQKICSHWHPLFTPSTGITSAVIDFYEDPFVNSHSVISHLYRVVESRRLFFGKMCRHTQWTMHPSVMESTILCTRNLLLKKFWLLLMHTAIIASCITAQKNALKVLSFDVEIFFRIFELCEETTVVQRSVIYDWSLEGWVNQKINR